MPVVTIAWIEGRTPEQKAKIAEHVISVIADTVDIDPAGIVLRFVDTPASDWSVGGRGRNAGADPSAGP